MDRNIASFPTTQEKPQMELVEGYELPEALGTYETDFWKIMTKIGPMYLPSIGKRHDTGQNDEVILSNRARLREETFGGVLYNAGIAFLLNKPAYALLRNLQKSGLATSEMPHDFISRLTAYGIVESA